MEVLKSGGVAVIPTDTIYGIVGSALNPQTVARIYNIRKRAGDKPCIILVSDIGELGKFSINLSDSQKEIFKTYSDLPTSIILDCEEESLEYLHRGTQTLAFRVPNLPELRDVLAQTGPLIAPSANIEGELPAKNIPEAREYFGEQVDLYLDGGEIAGQPSRVIKLHKDGQVDIIRQ